MKRKPWKLTDNDCLCVFITREFICIVTAVLSGVVVSWMFSHTLVKWYVSFVIIRTDIPLPSKFSAHWFRMLPWCCSYVTCKILLWYTLGLGLPSEREGSAINIWYHIYNNDFRNSWIIHLCNLIFPTTVFVRRYKKSWQPRGCRKDGCGNSLLWCWLFEEPSIGCEKTFGRNTVLLWRRVAE